MDIDHSAIDIAKLRLWLSLVVDEEDFYKIKPLPNLDYKIVCGNSLIGYPYAPQGLEAIEKLKKIFFELTEHNEKEKYRKRINEAIEKLLKNTEKTLGYKVDFGFKIHFSEVFHGKNGFDIVIANPPYVRQEDIKEYKLKLQKSGYKVYNSTSDLYTYFYEVSYNILALRGFSCFITSNKWMRAKYGEKLRNFFKAKTKVLNLIDFGGHKVFEATVDTNIILFQKTQPSQEYKLPFVNIETDFSGEGLDEYLNIKQQSIKQSDLNDSGWTLADDKVLTLKKKIEQIGTPLKDWDINIYRGITTGFNEAFIIDTPTKERLCKEDPKSVEILKPILRGRDINKYFYTWSGYWIIYSYTGIKIEKYPAVLNHQKQYRKELEQVWEAKHGKKQWYELRGCDYYEEFEKEKIVWQEIVREPSFAYDIKNIYCEATTFLMTGKGLKYLIAILNSKPVTFFFKQFYAGGGLGESGYRYKKAFLERLPIPKISESEQKSFIDLVNKILEAKKKNPTSDTTALEREIDVMVYKLYGLTEEEIKIIESN